MKWVFFLLLIVNVLLGGYLYLQNTRPNPDAQIMTLQMNADKIRIIPEPPRPKPKPVQPTRTACLEWGSFGALELQRVREALAPMALGERVSTREDELTATWWVYMPRQLSRARMERKADELRQLGITDLITIPDRGRWQYAISLGVFRNEAGARSYLDKLRKLGVRSAVAEEREQQVTQTTLTIRAPRLEESTKLLELATQFPGSDMRASECEG